MSTTTIPNRPHRRTEQSRVYGRAPETAGARDDREYRVYREYHENHVNRLDILTAALVGVSVGAGLTFLLRRGPSGERPVRPLMMGVGRGAGWAGRRAARLGSWAAHRGGDVLDRFPGDEIREHIGDYVGRARDAIDDALSCELRDLRRAARRQRRRFGF